MPRGGTVSLLLLAAAQSPADELRCPAGTKLELTELAELKVRAQTCVDEKTRLPHGPGRAFNDRGELLVELEFEAGEQVSQLFTAAGARKVLADVNGALEMMRMPAKITETDGKTLKFDINVVPPEGEVPDKEQITADLQTDPYTCLLLGLPGGPYESMNVRYQDPGGRVWMEIQLRREDCPLRK